MWFALFTAPVSDRRDTWLAAVIRRRRRRSLPYLQSAVSEMTSQRKRKKKQNSNDQLRDHWVSRCKLNWKYSIFAAAQDLVFGPILFQELFALAEGNKRLNKQTNGNESPVLVPQSLESGLVRNVGLYFTQIYCFSQRFYFFIYLFLHWQTFWHEHDMKVRTGAKAEFEEGKKIQCVVLHLVKCQMGD